MQNVKSESPMYFKAQNVKNDFTLDEVQTNCLNKLFKMTFLEELPNLNVTFDDGSFHGRFC